MTDLLIDALCVLAAVANAAPLLCVALALWSDR